MVISMRTILIGLFALLCVPIPARAQVNPVPCIDTGPGCVGALRTLGTSPGATILIGGYYQTGDSAGGEFYARGSCPTVSQSGTWPGPNGPNTIHYSGSTSVSPGMAIVEGQTGVGLPAYDIVEQVNTSTNDIILWSPVTNATVMSGTVNFSADNGGSIVRDNEMTPVCYYRATSQYTPKEWGAHGDGSSDDTAPLQNWLNALQPHYGVAGTFMVTSPLTCPVDATVQGPANLTGNNPLFTIMASSSFSGLLPPGETLDDDNNPIAVQGVIGALAYCRLSGVNIVGNGYFLPTAGSTTFNSNCITVAATTGLNVGNYVVGGNIAEQTTVAAIASCGTGGNVLISQNATGTSSGENITFYGPDAVDVLAERVAIDGFSALSYGGRNLVCINTKAAGAGLQVKNSQLTFALDEDVHSVGGCPNARFIGDIVSIAGKATGYGPSGGGTVNQVCGTGNPTCSGEGMNLSGAEATISDGVIEESQGTGLDLHGAQKISVNAMHIQGNGEGPLGGQGDSRLSRHPEVGDYDQKI